MNRIAKIIFYGVFLGTIILGGLILSNQPNDDILNNKMDCIMTVVALSPVLIVEIEIYNIFTYVFKKRKNKTITFFKIFSLTIALLFIGLFIFSFYTTTNKIEIILLVVFLVYVLLKLLMLIFQKNI